MEASLRAACIRAIVENPFDQAQRLIYLDALEENGNAVERQSGASRRAEWAPNFGFEVGYCFDLFPENLDRIVEVVISGPIQSITFSDKKPEENYDSFFWHSRGNTPVSTIPMEFFEGIPSETQRFWRARNGHCGIHFLTKDEAYRWLSERAIDYGRRMAGLTPIDWEKAREVLKLQETQVAS